MENRTVLIVDDDEQMRRANERTFKIAGWRTWTADGVQQAKRLLHNVDVVLSDYHMLDGNGDDIVKLAGDIPVVILTGSPKEVKHTHVLCKPTSAVDIIKAVTEVLFQHERHSRR